MSYVLLLLLYSMRHKKRATLFSTIAVVFSERLLPRVYAGIYGGMFLLSFPSLPYPTPFFLSSSLPYPLPSLPPLLPLEVRPLLTS